VKIVFLGCKATNTSFIIIKGGIMKILNMKPYSGSNNLKAFFDIETSEGIIVKGFKIADSKNGLFVGVPSEQDKNDQNKYWDKVILPKETKDKLTAMALDEYQQQKEN
jgi:DNA-binding cell septation regulator SpoVG